MHDYTKGFHSLSHLSALEKIRLVQWVNFNQAKYLTGFAVFRQWKAEDTHCRFVQHLKFILKVN